MPTATSFCPCWKNTAVASGASCREKHSCEYALKGCRCEGGVMEPDCDEVLCGEPASIKIHRQWYCEKHGDRVQAILDRHQKGTPLPARGFSKSLK